MDNNLKGTYAVKPFIARLHSGHRIFKLSQSLTLGLLACMILLAGTGPVHAEEPKKPADFEKIWEAQRAEISTAKLKVRIFRWGGSGIKAITSVQLLQLVKSAKLETPKGLANLIHQLAASPIDREAPWGEIEMVTRGTDTKEAQHGKHGDVQISAKGIRAIYQPINRQVTLYNEGDTARHIRTLDDFRYIPPASPKVIVKEGQNGSFNGLQGDYRMVIDPKSGAVLQHKIGNKDGQVSRLLHQGYFSEYPGGIVFPRLVVDARFSDSEKLDYISLTWLDSAEFNSKVPDKAFQLATPDGVNVFDNRGKSKRVYVNLPKTEDVVAEVTPPRDNPPR